MEPATRGTLAVVGLAFGVGFGLAVQVWRASVDAVAVSPPVPAPAAGGFLPATPPSAGRSLPTRAWPGTAVPGAGHAEPDRAYGYAPAPAPMPLRRAPPGYPPSWSGPPETGYGPAPRDWGYEVVPEPGYGYYPEPDPAYWWAPELHDGPPPPRAHEEGSVEPGPSATPVGGWVYSGAGSEPAEPPVRWSSFEPAEAVERPPTPAAHPGSSSGPDEVTPMTAYDWPPGWFPDSRPGADGDPEAVPAAEDAAPQERDRALAPEGH